MTSRERVARAIHFEEPNRVPHFLPDGRENDILWLWPRQPPPRHQWTNTGDHDVMIDCWGTKIQQDQQENMGLELLDEKFGGKVAFWCPVDIQNTMVNGSPDDVARYVKRMISTLGAHQGGLVSMIYKPIPEDPAIMEIDRTA